MRAEDKAVFCLSQVEYSEETTDKGEGTTLSGSLVYRHFRGPKYTLDKIPEIQDIVRTSSKEYFKTKVSRVRVTDDEIVIQIKFHPFSKSLIESKVASPSMLVALGSALGVRLLDGRTGNLTPQKQNALKESISGKPKVKAKKTQALADLLSCGDVEKSKNAQNMLRSIFAEATENQQKFKLLIKETKVAKRKKIVLNFSPEKLERMKKGKTFISFEVEGKGTFIIRRHQGNRHTVWDQNDQFLGDSQWKPERPIEWITSPNKEVMALAANALLSRGSLYTNKDQVIVWKHIQKARLKESEDALRRSLSTKKGKKKGTGAPAVQSELLPLPPKKKKPKPKPNLSTSEKTVTKEAPKVTKKLKPSMRTPKPTAPATPTPQAISNQSVTTSQAVTVDLSTTHSVMPQQGFLEIARLRAGIEMFQARLADRVLEMQARLTSLKSVNLAMIELGSWSGGEARQSEIHLLSRMISEDKSIGRLLAPLSS